ncbi:MAG TPA: amidohydrolase family protein, partial [Actinomycetota bacterium]|nr:amidohydrolase family protein [Actinomycetota bacterium]
MSPGTLVRGRFVLDPAPPAPGGRAQTAVIAEGAVYQVGGTIVAVGPFADLRATHPDAEVVGSGSDVVLPGFVNGHHHVGLTPFQLGSPDLPLELWVISRLGARTVDPYLDTLCSAFELIASGVTTVQHIQSRLVGPQEAWLPRVDAMLAAYRDVGMRVSFSFNLRDQSRLIYGDDDAFAASLPEPPRCGAQTLLAEQGMPLAQQLDCFFFDLRRRWDSDRTRVQLAPSNYHWLSDTALEEIASLSETTGVPMHMHVLETPYQRVYGRRRAGGSVVARLAELGLVGPRLTAGH